MKKVLLMLLSFVLVFSLVACTPAEENVNTEEPTTEAPKVEEPKAEATPDTIKVWTFEVYKGYGEDLPAVITEFQKENPNVTVEFEVLSWSEGAEKFATALNAGTPPDLFFGAITAERLDTGLAVPITPYVSAEEIAKYNQTAVKYFNMDGELYGLPEYVALQTWAGEKSALETIGFDYKAVQENGWTWDEFYEWGVVAKEAGYKYPMVFQGTNGSRGDAELFTHLTQNNGIPHFASDGALNVARPEALETLEFIEKLLQDGILPEHMGEIAPGDRNNIFKAKESAFFGRAIPYYDAIFAQRNIDIDNGDAEGNKVEVVLLPVPVGPSASGEAAYGIADGYTLWKQLDTTEEHIQNAANFLSFVTGPANNAPSKLVLGPVYEGQDTGNDLAKEWNSAFSARYTELIVPPANLTVEDGLNLSKFTNEVLYGALESFYSTEGPGGNGNVTAQEIYDRFVKAEKDLWK